MSRCTLSKYGKDNKYSTNTVHAIAKVNIMSNESICKAKSKEYEREIHWI